MMPWLAREGEELWMFVPEAHGHHVPENGISDWDWFEAPIEECEFASGSNGDTRAVVGDDLSVEPEVRRLAPAPIPGAPAPSKGGEHTGMVTGE